MSENGPHAAERARQATAAEMARPRWRSMRKELLIMRADVERAEIYEAVTDVRRTFSRLGWLRLLVPGIAGLRTASGKAGGLGALLKEYPLLSSLVSLLIARPLGGAIAKKAKPILKWAGIAFAGWEALQVWRAQRRDRQSQDDETVTPPTQAGD